MSNENTCPGCDEPPCSMHDCDLPASTESQDQAYSDYVATNGHVARCRGSDGLNPEDIVAPTPEMKGLVRLMDLADCFNVDAYFLDDLEDEQ